MITLVTCAFNNLDELITTLASIKRCNLENVTIINGSTQNDIELYLQQNGNNYNVINQPDQGIYDAFNKGWKNADGDFIYYANSGDILINEDNYLQKADNFLQTNPDYDFVHADIIFVDQELGEIKMQPTKKNIGYGIPFLHPSMVVRKSAFEKLNGFNKNYKIAGDYDFVARLLKEGAKGHYIPLVVTKMDGSGVSTSQEHKAIKECKKSLTDNEIYSGSIRFGFYVRYFKFFSRRLLDKSGLNFLKLFIKRQKFKHS